MTSMEQRQRPPIEEIPGRLDPDKVGVVAWLGSGPLPPPWYERLWRRLRREPHRDEGAAGDD